MKRQLVAITQRVIVQHERGERLDTLDQAWLTFLQASDIELVPIPNCHPTPVAFVRRLGIQGIILSGGNNLSKSVMSAFNGNLLQMEDVAPERDKVEVALLRESIVEGWTVMGVCRGMQMLNVFHGGGLSPVEGHARTRHPIEVTQQIDKAHRLDLLSPIVNSFHNYGILQSDLAQGFLIWAQKDETIEAFAHASLPHYGIMWHPERSRNESDIELFKYLFSR